MLLPSLIAKLPSGVDEIARVSFQRAAAGEIGWALSATEQYCLKAMSRAGGGPPRS